MMCLINVVDIMCSIITRFGQSGEKRIELLLLPAGFQSKETYITFYWHCRGFVKFRFGYFFIGNTLQKQSPGGVL